MVKLIRKQVASPSWPGRFINLIFMFHFFRALAVIMLLPAFAFAQFSLSGHIYDAATNQPLPGAAVQLSATKGQATNTDGYFSFPDLPAGNYTVRVTYLGFEPVS